jgi:hypothetical protein
VRYSKFSEAKYWHYAENRITDALFAFDAGNGNNNSQNVHIGPIVNEGNAVFNMTGPVYFSGNSTQYTIRDNLYWNNATLIYAPQVHATNFAGAFNGKILGVAGIVQSKVYRNKVYRANGTGGNGAYLYSYFSGSNLLPIQSITWESANGGRAVVNTRTPHNLVIGSVLKLYLTGQSPAGYSGTKDVEITGTNQFKFRSADLGTVSSPGSWFFAYAHPQQFTDNIIVDLRASPNIGQHIYTQLMQAGSIIKRNQYWAPNSSSFLYDVNAARTLAQIQALPGAPEQGSIVADPKWPDPANGNFGQLNFLLRRDVSRDPANDSAPMFVDTAA